MSESIETLVKPTDTRSRILLISRKYLEKPTIKAVCKVCGKKYFVVDKKDNSGIEVDPEADTFELNTGMLSDEGEYICSYCLTKKIAELLEVLLPYRLPASVTRRGDKLIVRVLGKRFVFEKRDLEQTIRDEIHDMLGYIKYYLEAKGDDISFSDGDVDYFVDADYDIAGIIRKLYALMLVKKRAIGELKPRSFEDELVTLALITNTNPFQALTVLKKVGYAVIGDDNTLGVARKDADWKLIKDLKPFKGAVLKDKGVVRIGNKFSYNNLKKIFKFMKIIRFLVKEQNEEKILVMETRNLYILKAPRYEGEY